MKNKIVDLRNHLFETLEALKDKDNPMPIERAQAISNVAQTIVNSVKVEVDFMKVTGSKEGTGFLPEPSSGPQKPTPRLVGNR